MTQFNPYAATQVQNPITSPTGEAFEISPVAMNALKKTRPWLLVTSIFLLILAGLQVIQLFIQFYSASGVSFNRADKATLFISGAIVIAIYATLGIKLFAYSSAISRLSYSNNPVDFEKAMNVHSSYWKFISILTIISIVLALASVLF